MLDWVAAIKAEINQRMNNYTAMIRNHFPMVKFHMITLEDRPKVLPRNGQCLIKDADEDVPAVLIDCRRNKREWEAWVKAGSQYQLKRLVDKEVICKECALYAASLLDTQKEIMASFDQAHLRRLHLDLKKESGRETPTFGPWAWTRPIYGLWNKNFLKP